uniref:ZP domain-containing protein n=1 Tax=Plectus sambesii TaxID=2011161 RepID=A0A914V312_9BILA
MFVQRLLWTILACLSMTTIVTADGFVEEVSCSSESLTVMLNKSDPDIQKWMASQASKPVAYVYGYKERTPCGVSLKDASGRPSYNFTVPYGQHCAVQLADLEPNYQTAETTIAMEDLNVTDPSKTLRINHVFCLYTRRVQTIKFSDVSSGHEVVASTGGKPKPKVEMLFRTLDNKPVRAAKFGDTVGFYLALSKDQAYQGITPKECMFSDSENMHSPAAKHLTFVQSDCPVSELSEIIDPLINTNEEVYSSHFKTFRFGNQTTVFAHCTVQVCLDAAECSKKCFKRVQNANLTAERLRFRYRREASATGEDEADPISSIAVSNALTILDDDQTLAIRGQSVEQCVAVAHIRPMYVAMALLGGLAAFSLLTVFCLVRRLRLQSKLLEARAMSITTPCTTSIYEGYSLPRRHSYIGLDASSFVGGTGTMRSISEISAPRQAWVQSFSPDHQIPRVR